MPEWLTRKIGPLPAWGYAALAGGVFVLLRLRKSSGSTSATPSSANYTATAPDIPTASVTEPGGFSYTGPLGGLSQLIPTGALAATNGTNSGNLVRGTIGTAAGQFSHVPSPLTNAQLAAGGVTQYAEPVPGQFVRIPLTPTGPGGVKYAQAQNTYIQNA